MFCEKLTDIKGKEVQIDLREDERILKFRVLWVVRWGCTLGYKGKEKSLSGLKKRRRSKNPPSKVTSCGSVPSKVLWYQVPIDPPKFGS
ncbi:hypothetical protein CDAR_246911 [Caerostris darwini]|uniref:Uncharacterized protein n=1 Tax=Caerostris darwini TaxID=1538125 RepID=A0AAV4X059_9ARAC|nr:hypothetical protein CDAR_246911 [Caerostris darwini]